MTVLRGKILEKLDDVRLEDELIMGIDPGKRTGFSAYFLGSEIANSLYMTIDKLIDEIISILSQLRAKKRLIKIGNGDMKLTNKITNLLNLRYCSDFDVEIVDESKKENEKDYSPNGINLVRKKKRCRIKKGNQTERGSVGMNLVRKK